MRTRPTGVDGHIIAAVCLSFEGDQRLLVVTECLGIDLTVIMSASRNRQAIQRISIGLVLYIGETAPIAITQSRLG